MNEKIDKIDKQIEELRKKKQALIKESLKNSPLVGKYIKFYTMGGTFRYMEIKEVEYLQVSKVLKIKGPQILAFFNDEYVLETYSDQTLPDEYTEITKEEFKEVFDKAISKFKDVGSKE